jgi:uncharacterized membrane protein YeaQ/YmgE (transglycosylase-associated protein family)
MKINKWGLGGVIIIVLLGLVGALTAFPIFQAFGAVFLLGTFPLIFAMSIPLIIGGWFLGRLAEKIFESIK